MKDYVLDVSFMDKNRLACFCPYEDGDVVFGLNLISERCPGNLIGIVHMSGEEEVNIWIKNNPDWYERYKNEKITN